MPKVRDWMNTNSWLVNIIVYIVFILLILFYKTIPERSNAMALHTKVTGEGPDAQYLSISPLFAGEGESTTVPKHRMPDGPMSPEMAYEIIHDELMLDGNARLNLATFVTTWMEPQAEKLMAECLDKNMIDKDEYPQTAELEMRCVNMLSRLWNSPDARRRDGMLDHRLQRGRDARRAGAQVALAQRRRAAGQSTERPNMVMGANVQVCWEKFCRYWEVEPRLRADGGRPFPPRRRSRRSKRCDENTIGVVAVLGSTFDGSYEPVAEICAALDESAGRTGLDIPVHVDGASGGFVAPFLDPDLVWDFRLPRVESINTSGHKYGLVYPGVGWVDLARPRRPCPTTSSST